MSSTILLVDDDPNFIEIFSMKLGAAGLHVETAHSAQDAIHKAERLRPDLILMDISMPPGSSGTDAALAIKHNPKTSDLKIAFLTDMHDPWPRLAVENEELAKEIGVDGFIQKATDLDEVVRRVKKLLKIE